MQNLKVTFIQSVLHWENMDANLKMFSQKISSIKEKTDLIVLPEMFNTGFTMNTRLAEKMNGRTMQWMEKMAQKKNCVITGSIIIKDSLPNGRGSPPKDGLAKARGGAYFNRLIWMKPNGDSEIYDKRHLFRYANEQNYYTQGKKKLIVEWKGWKICPMICYDLRFPVWIRNKNMEYDILIFVTNWPERRNHPWKILLIARAIENQCYVIGVNRVGQDGKNIEHSGDSTVISPTGETLRKTKPHEESVETVSLSRKELDEWRKIFPAWMDADKFKLAAGPMTPKDCKT